MILRLFSFFYRLHSDGTKCGKFSIGRGSGKLQEVTMCSGNTLDTNATKCTALISRFVSYPFDYLEKKIFFKFFFFLQLKYKVCTLDFHETAQYRIPEKNVMVKIYE